MSESEYCVVWISATGVRLTSDFMPLAEAIEQCKFLRAQGRSAWVEDSLGYEVEVSTDGA
jgi:hypothetical protein